MEWENNGNQLVKEFEFTDFIEAWAFMTKVAFLAEKHSHHPNWTNVYNKVQIKLNTHETGSITHKDFLLANEIDRLETC